MRFGLDFRRVHADSIGGNEWHWVVYVYGICNAESGGCMHYSVQPHRALRADLAFADLLFGLPQQSAIQAGAYKTICERMSLTGMRRTTGARRANLTLNYGLRYEYFAPYVEKFNRLVNLDHNADFTEVQPV